MKDKLGNEKPSLTQILKEMHTGIYILGRAAIIPGDGIRRIAEETIQYFSDETYREITKYYLDGTYKMITEKTNYAFYFANHQDRFSGAFALL